MDLQIGKKKGKKMGQPVKATQSNYKGEEILHFVIDSLNVSETMVAALLDVTTRSLDNWKKLVYPDGLTGKAKRLKALYDFLEMAQQSVSAKELMSLLTETIDPEDETSKSPIYYIVEDPESSFFKDFSKLAIAKFLK